MHCSYIRPLLLLLCLSMTGNLVANPGPIRVKVNENTTISFFFPAQIAKVIEPTAHFNFSYEKDNNLATLQATKGNPSNLTVITDTGNIYSFALSYSENIQHFTYMITTEQAIGTRGGAVPRKTEFLAQSSPGYERGDNTSDDILMETIDSTEDDDIHSDLTEEDVMEIKITDSKILDGERSEDNYVEEASFYDMDREGYYEIFCENTYLQRTITENNMRSNSGVDLRLNHMAIDHNEIYFALQFRNVSKSDYQIRNVRFYIQTLGNEELPMTPLYTYKLADYIKQSAVNKFVYVFKDFKLGTNQKVYIVMKEKQGHRNIVLPLNMEELWGDLE